MAAMPELSIVIGTVMTVPRGALALIVLDPSGIGALAARAPNMSVTMMIREVDWRILRATG